MVTKNLSQASSALKAFGLLAAVSVGALSISPKADAALLFSDTDSFSNVLTELTGAPDLVVDKFNGTGFNVTSVVVSLTASLRSQGTVTNTAAQPQTFRTITQVLSFDIIPGAGAPGVLNPLSPFSSITTIGNVLYTNLAPNTPAAFGPFTASGGDSATYTGSAIAGFLGTGTITFDPFTQIGTTFAGGGGNTANAIQTFADASLTIEYFGDQIPQPPVGTPEPSVLAGLGLMAGLGAMAKRKKA